MQATLYDEPSGAVLHLQADGIEEQEMLKKLVGDQDDTRIVLRVTEVTNGFRNTRVQEVWCRVSYILPDDLK